MTRDQVTAYRLATATAETTLLNLSMLFFVIGPHCFKFGLAQLAILVRVILGQNIGPSLFDAAGLLTTMVLVAVSANGWCYFRE